MRIFKLFFILLLLTLSTSSHGAIYSIITKKQDAQIGNLPGILYEYTILSWDYEDMTPNPCYGRSSCFIALGHRHVTSGGGGKPETMWASKGVRCVVTSKTTGELGKCLRDYPSNVEGNGSAGVVGIPHVGVRLELPFSSLAGHAGSLVTQECVGIFWDPDFMGIGTPGRLLPGSVCGLAPPPSGACGMPDTITLDHGVLAEDSVEGSVARQQIFVDCNKKINGKLNLTGLLNGKLPVGEGINSTIGVNGSPLGSSGTTLKLEVGANPLVITSTLSTSGKVSTGEHTGQGVLILSLE